MLNVSSNLCRMVTPEGELRSGSQNLFLSEVEVLSTLSHPNIVRCGSAAAARPVVRSAGVAAMCVTSQHAHRACMGGACMRRHLTRGPPWYVNKPADSQA